MTGVQTCALPIFQGRDWVKRPPAEGVPPLQILHESLRNEGTWTILTGADHPSVLRLPGVLRARSGAQAGSARG